MNIEDWQNQVWNCPNMNPTAVAICLAIGSHGHWSKSQTVWPTRQRISSMTGASRDTVGKYMTELEQQGWLKIVKMRRDNVREYELTKPEVVVVSGILAVKKRGNTDNLKNQVVVDNGMVDGSYDKQVVVDNGLVVENYDSNLPRTFQENLQEELSNTSTTAVGGGTPISKENKEDESSSLIASFNSREMIEAFISWSSPLTDKDFKARLKELAMDRTFEPEENQPNHRLQKAAEKINEERGILL